MSNRSDWVGTRMSERIEVQRQTQDQGLRADGRRLIELAAEEQASLLTSVNPRRLLASEPVIPVSPLAPIETGMVGRLRELIFRKR